MKKNKLKAKIMIVIFLFLFILFLIFYLKPRNYTKEFKINNFKIVEKYDVINNYYKYIIKDKKTTFSYIIKSAYKNKRNLIKEIKIRKNKESLCVLPKSDYLNFYPLCKNTNNEISTLNTVNNKINYEFKKTNKIGDNYKKIKINYLYDKSYLIYNYKGFFHINSKYRTINLYDKDYYNNNTIYQYNNKLIVAKIENDYFINSFYIIDGINGKKQEISMPEKINLNIRFIGAYKNSVYFIDEKEEREYEINLRKKGISEVLGKIYDGNKFVNYKVSSIINKDLKFKEENIFEYQIINNKIYQIIDKNKILLSNIKATKIIKIDDYSVYYLSDDKLYVYNLYDGEIFLLEYFEWNFNNDNVIFIF